MPKLWQRPKRFQPTRPRRTSIGLSAADLAALGRLVAVGQAVLQERPPVVGRLKAAITRLGLEMPKGL